MLSLVVSVVSVLVAILIYGFQIGKKISQPSIYLSIFFLIYGIYGISHYIMLDRANVFLYAVFFNNFTPFYVLIGPSLYLYVKKTINDESCVFCLDELWHLIPAGIVLVDLSPYLFETFEFKTALAKSIIANTGSIQQTPHLLLSDYWASLFRQWVNLIYLLVCLKLILLPKHKLPLSNKQEKIVYNWLRILICSMTLFFIFMILYLLSLKINFNSDHIDLISDFYLKTTWYIHAVLIFIIFLFPSILYGLPHVSPSNPLFHRLNEKMNMNEIEYESATKKNYKVFELEDAYLKEIHDTIERYIQSLPFTLDKFSLSVLTSETKIPMHHLNLYFKNYLNTSFNAWKNKLKIDYALSIINSGVLNEITIEAVALKSGFKSYSNFFAVFKAQTGIAPSEYIEHKKASFQ